MLLLLYCLPEPFTCLALLICTRARAATVKIRREAICKRWWVLVQQFGVWCHWCVCSVQMRPAHGSLGTNQGRGKPYWLVQTSP
jgi:hypothetical protein